MVDALQRSSPLADWSERITGLLKIYRIIDAEQYSTPFCGAGSDRGGRWTSQGTPGVYASLSASTALLEYLAHLEADAPAPLFLASAWLPRPCLLVPRELPPGWDQRPYRSEVRAIGDDWSLAKRSLALQVPSALCHPDQNVIINPCHDDFGQLVPAARTPFSLDDRLACKTTR